MASKLVLLAFIYLYSLHIAVATAPVFSQKQYSACVTNDATAGTIVTTITATDANNVKADYAIIDGNAGKLFRIDGNTGTITIQTGKSLPSVPSKYTLTCGAIFGTASDNAIVNVTVTVQVSCHDQTNNYGGTETISPIPDHNTGTSYSSSTGSKPGGQESSSSRTTQIPNDPQNKSKTTTHSTNSSERAYGGTYIWIVGTVITALISFV